MNMPTTHQNFSDDMLINGAIKRGERVDLFTRSTSLTWSNIVKDIAAFYDIDDAISDRLKLNFTSIPLTLNDLHLKVRYNAGDKIERDFSCDSTYMLSSLTYLSFTKS